MYNAFLKVPLGMAFNVSSSWGRHVPPRQIHAIRLTLSGVVPESKNSGTPEKPTKQSEHNSYLKNK